jgi:hypothetical protein
MSLAAPLRCALNEAEPGPGFYDKAITLRLLTAGASKEQKERVFSISTSASRKPRLRATRGSRRSRLGLGTTRSRLTRGPGQTLEKGRHVVDRRLIWSVCVVPSRATTVTLVHLTRSGVSTRLPVHDHIAGQRGDLPARHGRGEQLEQ